MDANSKGSRVVESIISQAIDELTESFVRKIPIEVISSLKAIGADKILPIVSVAIQTMLSKNTVWGTTVGNFVSEFTAELRSRINEGDSSTGAENKNRKTDSFIFNALLTPELSDKIDRLLKALADLYKGKNEKEAKAINNFLAKLSSDELISFLLLTKKQRNNLVERFAKGEKEKSLEEAIQEIKKEMATLATTLRAEVFNPIMGKLSSAYSEVGNKCAPIVENVKDSVKTNAADINGKAKSFRDRAKAWSDATRT